MKNPITITNTTSATSLPVTISKNPTSNKEFGNELDMAIKASDRRVAIDNQQKEVPNHAATEQLGSPMNQIKASALACSNLSAGMNIYQAQEMQNDRSLKVRAMRAAAAYA